MIKDFYAKFSDLTKEEQIQLFNLLNEDFIISGMKDEQQQLEKPVLKRG